MAAQLIDPLDMLPAHPVGRHGVFRRRGSTALARGQKGAGHIIGVSRLGQIVNRPGLHRGNGGGDVPIAGEHDHSRVRPLDLHHLHDLKAVPVLQAQIEHGKGGRAFLHGGDGLGHGTDRPHLKAARLQRPAQPRAQGCVIVQHQQ